METLAAPSCAIYASNLCTIAGQGRHQKFLLRNVSIGLAEGSFTAIIGASGCGKSTLIRTLAGIQSCTTGEVLLAGYPVQTLRSQLPLAVGYLPQFGAFHGELTVAEILYYASALRLPASVPKITREQWCEHVIDLARVRTLLHQKYRTLSGGQMRRIALAEELIGDPAFLFLDELTSGLDPYSDHELMVWLRELAHLHHKTIVLVTHSVSYLHLCDSVLFMHDSRLCHQGTYQELMEAHGAENLESIFGAYQEASVRGEFSGFDEDRSGELPPQPEPKSLKTAPPPSGFSQIFTLIGRQTVLLLRDKAQLWLHLALLATFPCLVAIFASNGLPQVRTLSLTIESNIVQSLAENLSYLKESFTVASLVSGLAMFQVILLTLMGSNNGAREIAKERDVLEKELRAGLSPWAYVCTKFLVILVLSLVQSFWMAWFVKTVCGFPGDLSQQFGILFATNLGMSSVCLLISSACQTPERASLLAIYLVGLQLPLSGAVLALPDMVSFFCRPFIAAYWGWSGYLKTLAQFRHYDIVRQSTDTAIAEFNLCLLVLGLHTLVSVLLAWVLVARRKG